MKQIEKVRDKFWDERRPGFDLDRVEMQVYLPEAELDSFLRQHASQYLSRSTNTPSDLMYNRRRYDKLMYKVFRAAASCLTDRQFQIFIMRYKFQFKEIEIAEQAGVNQSYVSNTLKVCHSKIRKTLRLEKAKKRKPRKKSKSKHTPKSKGKSKFSKHKSKNKSKSRYKKKS